jgi:hypothetical protein
MSCFALLRGAANAGVIAAVAGKDRAPWARATSSIECHIRILVDHDSLRTNRPFFFQKQRSAPKPAPLPIDKP